MKKTIVLLGISFICVLLCVLTGFSVGAQEFRAFNPIPTPHGAVPKGAMPVKNIQPVQPGQAEEAVQELFKDWNKGDISKHLGKDFYDKTRLADTMTEKVPQDATIRLLAVRDVQTLEQYQRQSQKENTGEIISKISVRAATQIEFNDPDKGFRRLEGTNEYILQITEEVVH